ncbi:MAG: DUF2934 domain-containing protein, partial [Aestuariivirga sp.]
PYVHKTEGVNHMENIQETVTVTPSRDERVCLTAYQMWEDEGKPDGKNEEHWLRACEMVDAEIAFMENPELPEWLSQQKTKPNQQEKHPEGVEKLNHKQQRRSAA